MINKSVWVDIISDKEGNMHARILGIEVVYRKQEQIYRVITVFRAR